MTTAVFNGNSNTGIAKLSAKINLKKTVEKVDSQTCFSVVCLLDASSDICIPRASERASAIAIRRIPPRTTILELVPKVSPIINPKVVIIPEVSPNPNPFFIDIFMFYLRLFIF